MLASTTGPLGPRTETGPAASPDPSASPACIAIAVLLIVGGAVTALLAVRLDERAAVLVFRQPVPAVQQITRDDLAETQVASKGLGPRASRAGHQVVGRYAVTAASVPRLEPSRPSGSSTTPASVTFVYMTIFLIRVLPPVAVSRPTVEGTAAS